MDTYVQMHLHCSRLTCTELQMSPPLIQPGPKPVFPFSVKETAVLDVSLFLPRYLYSINKPYLSPMMQPEIYPFLSITWITATALQMVALVASLWLATIPPNTRAIFLKHSGCHHSLCWNTLSGSCNGNH